MPLRLIDGTIKSITLLWGSVIARISEHLLNSSPIRQSVCTLYFHPVLRSRSRLEPPLLGQLRSRSRFFFGSEPGAGAGADPSRSKPELKPPKKVAAPQHCFRPSCLGYGVFSSPGLRWIHSCLHTIPPLSSLHILSII